MFTRSRDQHVHPSRTRRTVVAAITTLTLSSIIIGTGAAPATAFPSSLMPSSGLFFGSRVAPRGSESGREALQRVESQIGRRFAIDHQYYDWNTRIPTAQQEWDSDTGRIPFVNWSAGGTRWSAIANGSQDSWIRDRAQAFKDFGSPIYLTFHHEPENDVGRLGTASEFAAAFRRIVTVFRDRGVSNVAFVWTMMAWTFNPRSDRDPNPYYPGDTYVDFIGGDGYNWYPGRPNTQWQPFSAIFTDINSFAVAHRKPWMVVEYGVLEDPGVSGRKGQWFSDAMTTAKGWSSLKALLYFDQTKLYRWDTDSSSSSMSAYRAIANDPHAGGSGGGGGGGGGGGTPGTPSSLSNTLDAGPDGASIRAGSSAGGSPFAAIGVSTGGSLTYDDTHRLGAFAARHVARSYGSSYYAWTGARSITYGRVYVWLDDLPDGDLQIVRATSGDSLRYAIGIDGRGTIEVIDQRSSTILSTSRSIRTDRWFRIEWMVDHTRGVAQVRFFDYGAGSTPTEVVTSSSGRYLGSGSDRIQFGASGRQSSWITFWTDAPAISSSGYPAP